LQHGKGAIRVENFRGAQVLVGVVIQQWVLQDDEGRKQAAEQHG
jgi:hypothetical protein